MDYILHRPSGYYFRLMVPSDLVESFDLKEIRRSLKTASLSLAKERAFLLSGRLKKLFRRIRADIGSTMKLTKEHIKGPCSVPTREKRLLNHPLRLKAICIKRFNVQTGFAVLLEDCLITDVNR